MKTLCCRLRKSTEHRSDSYIQLMMSHQIPFVLMTMVSPLRKLDDIIGCDHRIKNSVNMLLLESLRKCEPLLLQKLILSNCGNHFVLKSLLSNKIMQW